MRIDTGYDSLLHLDVVDLGTEISGAFEVAHQALGSELEYLRAEARIRHGLRLFAEHNLILRAAGHFALDPPFTEELEGGGVLLRGFQLRQYRGDSAIDAHADYSFPIAWLFSQKVAVRGVVFADSMALWFRDLSAARLQPDGTYLERRGDGSFRDFLPSADASGRTLPPAQGLTREAWHNDSGVGLRIFLRNVVVPLFGVDLGYGWEARGVQVYLSIGDTGG